VLLFGNGERWNQKNFKIFQSSGRAISEAFIRRTLTTEARVRSQTCLREICSGKSGNGTGFSSPITSVSPVNIIQPVLLTRLHLHVALHRRTKGRILRTFQKATQFRKWRSFDTRILLIFLVFKIFVRISGLMLQAYILRWKEINKNIYEMKL